MLDHQESAPIDYKDLDFIKEDMPKPKHAAKVVEQEPDPLDTGITHLELENPIQVAQSKKDE